jgi:hypothetical protein
MSDQNSPYEPPSGARSSAGDGTEQPGGGAGSPPPEPMPPEPMPPEPVPPEYMPPPGAPAPPPAGSPPGYEGAYQQQAYPAAPPSSNHTQLYGILGIVLAVVCCPLLGVLFGWLSMNEAKKTGSDDTLGKVGFWIGIALTAVGLVSAIIAICVGGISGWNNNNDY